MPTNVGTGNNLWVKRSSGLLAPVVRRNFPINGLVFYAPLWHPELEDSPFASKDLTAYSCTVVEATWASTGRHFDGDDDNISFTFDLDLLDTNYTLMAWVNADTIDRKQYILGSSTWVANTFYLRVESANNKLTFSANGGTEIGGDTVFVASTWYFVAVQTTDEVAQIYVNAVAEGDPSTANNNVANSHTLYIAKGHGENEWDGYIGEVAFYDRALSAAELLHIYRQTRWRY